MPTNYFIKTAYTLLLGFEYTLKLKEVQQVKTHSNCAAALRLLLLKSI